jgi:transcriptional regulator with PAS, ATPase and Fis domain
MTAGKDCCPDENADLLSAWVREFSGAVTLCDSDGIVLEMNEAAAAMYREYGGRKLIGTNLFECHPEAARRKLLHLLESGERNVYTIEKNGQKKLIFQAPFHTGGKRSGMVELALEIPDHPPHFIR